MIPDDEHKLIDDELEASDIRASATWVGVELACRELRMLRDIVSHQQLVMEKLSDQLATATQPRDLCAGRMVAEDENYYRCLRCGRGRTGYSRPSICGAEL